MARYGARIRNSLTGSIQIDDQHWNLVLLDKVVLTSSATQGPGATRFDLFYTVTSDDPPVVAIASEELVAFREVTKSGGDWTFWFATKNPSQSVTLYRYGKPTHIGPGWGVRIISGGSVRWDSRLKSARIVDTIRGSTMSPGTLSLPSGKTYAALITSTAFHWTLNVSHLSGSNYSHQEMVTAMGVKIAGNTVSWDDFSVMQKFIPSGAQGPSRIYDYLHGNYAFVLVDVTGH